LQDRFNLRQYWYKGEKTMGRLRGQLLREQQEDAVKKIEQIVGHADETPTQRRSFSAACADYKADVAVSRALKFRNGDRGVNLEQLTGRQIEQVPEQLNAGRKPKEESRAMELRQALIAWKRIPEAVRPSLRFLAAQLQTNHQLLSHFLGTLDEWGLEERIRIAKEQGEHFQARAQAEGRDLSRREAVIAIIDSGLLEMIAKIQQEFKLGPVNSLRIKTLKMLADQFPKARNLLQKCLQDQRPRTKKPLELTAKQEESPEDPLEGQRTQIQALACRGVSRRPDPQHLGKYVIPGIEQKPEE
jgi:hypothetical protein